jgi:ketosteroid isomerase-like protein
MSFFPGREEGDVERNSEIEELVKRWFAAAGSGDASLVAEHVSQEPHTRLIGSDPGEVFSGGQAVADFLRGEVEGAGGHATFVPVGIEAFSEGTVGWATTQVTITLPDGRSVGPRWSSVFHREGDRWMFVQTHASIGVPNDQIGWVYPDTP